MKQEAKHQSELNRKEAEHTEATAKLKNHIAWQRNLIDCLSFLYLTAKQKGDLDSQEQIKAKREIENAVEGHYDYQQRRNFSVRR